jgi:flagellar biosynthesis chaperone FliJ
MAQVNIDHMIDPKRPGYLKAGILLKPSELLEASRRGLKSHKGLSLELVETSANPLSAKVLRPLAPEETRQALENAKTSYGEAQSVCEQAFKKWREAMGERKKFAQEMLGSALTDAGVREVQRLDRALNAAEKDFRVAEDCEQQARIEVAHAENELQRWVDDERHRRQEATKAEADKKKPKTPTLAERLTTLKEKVTG